MSGRPSVVFNRPYLLVVTDHGTGEPLFLARVADPRCAPEPGSSPQGTAILP